MSDLEKTSHDEELDRLKQERQKGARLLEAALNQALLVPCLDEVSTVPDLLEATSGKVRSLIRFKATAFWLMAPDGLDFRLALCDPPTWGAFVSSETESLIDDGTVAWALRRNRGLTVRSGQGAESLLLHGLVTPDRDLGLFVGVLDEDLAHLPDLGRAFLTATLALTASTLHNLELYRLVQNLNEELKIKVDHLEETERERALYRQQLELKVLEKTEESRAKDLFIANVSHEMRTPLNGVLGMAELLAAGELGTEEREMVQTLRVEARSLLRLIDDVLDFSKLRGSKLEIELRPFSIVGLLAEIESSMGRRSAAKGLTFTLDVAPGFPENVEGDQGRLRQVLNNLIDNALKFTERGTISLVASFQRGDGDGGRLHFSVEDSGIGITEAQRERLFSPFSQGDASTTRRYGGTGLGLAISKHLVSLMGGDLAVESEPGRGSRFFFDVRVRAVAGEGHREFLPSTIVPSRFPGARILIVDDSRTNCKVAQALTKRLGLSSQAVASAREGLDLLEREPFDLVLMDIQMPQMDGLEATAAIRASSTLPDPTIPIVALTAGALEGDRQSCLEAGMDDYLAKPILPDALRQAIDGLLEKRRDRQGEGSVEELLDMELLKERMGGDEKFCLEIVGTFAEDLRERLDEARSKLAEGDLKGLALVAHALKGAAANSAAPGLQEEATALEGSCRSGDWQEATSAMERLETEARRFLTWWDKRDCGGWRR